MKNEKVVSLLPEYLQTYAQTSFLGSTADRVFSKGETKKINAFIGRKPSYYKSATDFYKKEINDDRQKFQLEPAVVYNNKVIDYPDYISHIATNGTNVSNPHRPLATEVYSWCPYINISKLDDYVDYYWCPFGAPIVKITSGIFISTIAEVGLFKYKISSVKPEHSSPVVKIDSFYTTFVINNGYIEIEY